MEHRAGGFRASTCLRTRAFWVLAGVLLAFSGVLCLLPLTGVLGFEHALVACLPVTVGATHYSLAMWRLRARMGEEGPGLGQVWTGIAGTAALGVLPSVLLVSLNALRVPNCDFVGGLVFYALFPGVGVLLGTSVGLALAAVPWRRTATALVYLLPLATILYGGWLMVTEPPVFAFGHFFGHFPGPIYDEVRRVTGAMVTFRLLTVGWSGLIVGLAILVAGRGGVAGLGNFVWRRAPVRPEEGAGIAATPRRAPGASLLVLLCAGLLLWGHLSRHRIGYVHDRRSIRAVLSATRTTPHFVIHYDPDSGAAPGIDLIARDHEFRYWQLSRFLGVEHKGRIHSYIFRDSGQKARLFGAERTMVARPWSGEMYLNHRGFPHRVLKHELAHVLSARFGAPPFRVSARWGVMVNMALVEGLAVAADWSSGRRSPHAWSKAMLELGTAPNLIRILGPTGFWTAAGRRAYTVAGSFSRFLIERYGIARYRRAYRNGDFPRVYRKPLARLVNEWRRYVLSLPLPKAEKRLARYRFRRRSIMQRRCPHEVADVVSRARSAAGLGSHTRAIRLYRQACRHDPGSIGLRLALARTMVGAGKLREARGLVDRVLAQGLPPVREALAMLQLARIDLLQGKIGRARVRLRKVLATRIPLGTSRLARVLLYATHNKQVGPTLVSYLVGSGRSGGILEVADALVRAPGDPVLSYLIGRRLHFGSRHARALPYLRTARAGLADPVLGREATRLSAVTRFHMKRYASAARLFRKLGGKGSSEGERLMAGDWMERCGWEGKQRR